MNKPLLKNMKLDPVIERSTVVHVNKTRYHKFSDFQGNACLIQNTMVFMFRGQFWAIINVFFRSH